ncbi:MAG: hypothetical protein E6J55_10680 [Deltaproteobacteria bacterium]|nr:MAG: hypothetical protein E6J55_10680 [Deltaproteobacteria bacterium]
MRLIAALVIGVAVVVAGRVAAVHFDEFGVVPKDKATAKCEFKAAAQVVKASKKIAACHVKRALLLGKLDEAAEETCETSVAAAYDAKVHGATCPACFSNLKGSTLVTIVDSQSGAVYCSGSTAFGTDDGSAKIPPDKATAKCENKVATKLAKLVGAITACHVKAAKVAFKTKITTDQNTDQSCEDAAKAAFTKTSTTGCTCVKLTDIANGTEALLDVSNEAIFCASPSGAFVDGTPG